MSTDNDKNYVIIGNGVAGINAALAIRERSASAHITVISRETEYYYSRTALMYIAMGTMTGKDTEPYERHFYQSRGIHLIYGHARDIDTRNKKVKMEDQAPVAYDKLLLATGAVVATHDWPGNDLKGVTGLISYQDSENVIRLMKNARYAVVVGGGLIGVELCEVFRHFHLDVTFLIRGPSYWHKALCTEEGQFTEKHIAAHGVHVITSDELARINGKNGMVESITTKSGRTLPCDILGNATGVKPEITLARQAGISCHKGILTDWQLKTDIPDIYAAGDCVEIQSCDPHFMEAIWYTARDMGNIAGLNMSGDSLSYNPGEWYNSAMFFEKEYTVAGRYGVLQEGETDYLYQDEDHSMRIILHNNILEGFSMIGSRWDHEVLLRFIREKKDLDYFLTHYREAQFNPELQIYTIRDNRNL